jgi:glyoxylase-like metal-dependent hydrolase (beta-lactamase superfamily II)
VKTASIEQVSDGVFAAIAAEGGVAVGNAGFVDLGGEVLVFDTHVTLFAGRELRTAAEQLAPVHNVVLSHWHGDHVYGAGAFDATVVATARTAELMHERTAQRLAEFEAAPPEDYADTPFAELVRTELPTLELHYPDETFDNERSFSGTTRSAEVITYGGGHTPSDAFLWLADERIVFTADLVFANGQPWVGDGDVDQWLLILEKIAELRPEKIAPGHGPVAGPNMIDVMRRYLDALRNAAPGDPNPFPELAFPEMWERNVTALADRAA